MLMSLREYEKSLASQNKALQDQLNAKIHDLGDMPDRNRQGLLSQSKTFQDQINARLQKINEMEEKVHREVWSQNKAYQEQINSRIQDIMELEEKNQKKLNEMGDNVRKVQSDFTEVGLKGVGSRNKAISYAVVILGVIFGIGTLYVFFINMQQSFTTYNLIVMTVMAIITITLLVIGTLL